MKSNIKVSGNIISELSEKIPSNIIAINELIKNSYDADATEVIINFDQESKRLYISDNGVGMDIDDINKLLHISKSEKIYGFKKSNGRYIQGSKGLGFLSVFKFGNSVTWRTNKNEGLIFGINFKDIISRDDISEYSVNVIKDRSILIGTDIEITLDEYTVKSLYKYLIEEKNYSKIINAFIDKDFKVIININGKNYSCNSVLNFYNNLPDRQLYRIKYDSKTQVIEYYHNKRKIITEKYMFNYNKFDVKINLLTFKFRSGNKSRVDRLFYNTQNDLTPLLYINNNLFNNYTIFDPHVLKNIKTGLSLNQMIGYINVISSDNRIRFNSDRTQFLQNGLTDNIIEFLYNINKRIQTIGGKKKRYLVDFDFLNSLIIPYREFSIGQNNEYFVNNIKEDFAFKKDVKITVEENRVKYSLFGRHIYAMSDKKNTRSDTSESNSNDGNTEKNKNGSFPAFIKLKKAGDMISIPSSQIDLKKYILSAKNSSENKIPMDEIVIIVDGVENINKILPSQSESCIKNIEYRYNDHVTGLVVSMLRIEFFQQTTSFNDTNKTSLLLELPTSKKYTINCNQVLNSLINQINKLKLDEFKEVIACSLRSIFEISVDTVKKSAKFNNFTLSGLENSVEEIIEYIRSNDSIRSSISNSTAIDYKSLGNLLIPIDFKNIIKKAHLGAHKSTIYLTDNDIHELATKSALFVVLINELITNNNIM